MRRKHIAYGSLALMAISLFAYWPTLSSDFIRLDDPQYVMENTLVRNPSISGAVQFFKEWQKPSTVAGYYQPLTMVSFMLDTLVSRACGNVLGLEGGADPFYCHLQNILLHGVACVLLMLLIDQVIGDLGVAFILAALFAIHPVNVESVAWISQRKTVLATPLAIGSLICYLNHGRRGGWQWLAASLGLYFLANLAKPTIVLLPLVLPLLDLWPLRRRVVASLTEKWPFTVIMVVMGYVAYESQSSSIAHLGVPNFESANVLMRWVALLAYNVTLYLGNIFWPLYLSPFRPVPASLSFATRPILLSLLVMIVVAITWAGAWRRFKPLFVGMTAFFITLILALGPVRFFDSCVADRFLYFPFIFLLLAAGAAVMHVEALSKDRVRLLRYVLCLLFVPLVILMHAQQAVWRDGISFWTHVADAVPNYCPAQVSLGMSYFDEHKWDEALKHAQRAVELRPDDSTAVGILGRVKTHQGQAREAVSFLQEAVRKPLDPDAGSAFVALAEALMVSGDTPGALEACKKAIELKNPAGPTYELLGDAMLKVTKQYDRAVECYRRALEATPDMLTARWNLGTALEAIGDRAGALKEYEDVIARCARMGQPSTQLLAAANELKRKLSVMPTSARATGS